MKYRNGREAKAGDVVVHLDNGGPVGGRILNSGVLYDLAPGAADVGTTDNGMIASIRTNRHPGASLCDCLHIDDVAAILAKEGLDSRPAQR